MDLRGANTVKQNSRRRTSTTATNSELKFGPSKILKNDIKLEKLLKAKLVEKCAELQSALKELELLKEKCDHEVKGLKEKLKELQKN